MNKCNQLSAYLTKVFLSWRCDLYGRLFIDLRLWLIGIDELDHSLFMYWFVWFYIENKVFTPHPLNFVCRLGVLTCYLDPADLGSFLQDSAGSLALWQQLAQCMSKGFISDSGRVSTTCSLNLLETTDILIFFLYVLSCYFQNYVWLTGLICVWWTVVLLADTSRSDAERQQHGSFRPVSPHWTVTSVRSFLPAVTPLTTTPGNPLTTRITQIFSSTGQQGIYLLPLGRSCYMFCSILYKVMWTKLHFTGPQISW